MKLLPSGFRAVAALGLLLLALGIAQALALFVRDEPYRLAAAALALLLFGGGAVVTALVLYNARAGLGRGPVSAADWCTAAALLLALAEAVVVLRATGSFFPLRMALWFRAADVFEPELPLMLAGTGLVALGAVATAALSGALWLWLYARGSPRRLVGALLSFAGAIPYVAFALVVRALVCREVAMLAAGRHLALRPSEQLAYRSLLGMAPGLLAAALSLGLAVGRGLWSFLEQARAAEERSDSFLAATVRGQRPWQIVLRQGLWLRRRRELGALLLGGLASAALIDILSNTLIDGFRPPGFPPYPTLGAALFLRGLTAAGAPAPLPPSWQLAHVLMVLASLLLLLAQSLPRPRARILLSGERLQAFGTTLLRGATSAHGLAPRPALQWVLGASGAGKSTLLRAWASQLPLSVLVPQDPDDALPAALSATDLARVARRGAPRGDRVVFDLLGRLGDERSRRRLSDPFTPATAFSRGERQRLVFCMALSRLRAAPGATLLLDEPTSAQDPQRTHAMLSCVRELLSAQATLPGALVLSSHDPETLGALLGQSGGQVLWFEGGAAHRFAVQGSAWHGAGPQPPALLAFRRAAGALLEARSVESSAPASGNQRLPVLPREVLIAGRRHAISREASVAAGELILLSGPSGSGKSTLLRALATQPPPRLTLGYVSQDPARAFPPDLPVRELLPPHTTLARLAHWFGPGLSGELLDRRLGTLSEGERHRLLLAAEVLRLEALPAKGEGRGPQQVEDSTPGLKLLLLDEPFGALDPAAHLRLMATLTAWLRESRGCAALLVSHTAQTDLGLARAARVPTREWRLE